MSRAASLVACGQCSDRRYVLCSSFNSNHKQYNLKGGGSFRTCPRCM
jgi:hypothetical protein